ncbi:MAG TPA: Hsp20/alpha crystallin family protein [Polyangiaceae bacterium]|jgi:HSP20 family molecular chaperone IbpA|nr:Hsp20/alpha crystallin family protein [Polyangiaceae bacterium]
MSESVAVQRNGSAPAKAYARRAISPPVDVFENADEVLVVADVPGVSSDAIDVRVENGVLTIEARRPADGPAPAPALAREYDEVDYKRTFRVPTGIDTTNISAETKNGTLVVRLPKIAAVKPRKIAVRPA